MHHKYMYESEAYSSRSYSSYSIINPNLGSVTHVWCTVHTYPRYISTMMANDEIHNKAVTASHIEDDH